MNCDAKRHGAARPQRTLCALLEVLKIDVRWATSKEFGGACLTALRS